MNSVKVWTAISMLVVASSAGDILLSAAMKRIGDLDAIRSTRGLFAVVKAVCSEKLFLFGLSCLIFSFFCLIAILFQYKTHHFTDWSFVFNHQYTSSHRRSCQ